MKFEKKTTGLFPNSPPLLEGSFIQFIKQLNIKNNNICASLHTAFHRQVGARGYKSFQFFALGKNISGFWHDLIHRFTHFENIWLVTVQWTKKLAKCEGYLATLEETDLEGAGGLGCE